jgi:superfamily II DNA/RNA helicase
VGRTARANTTGRGITLVSENDQLAFKKIEDFIGKTIEKMPLPKGVGEGPEYNPKKPVKEKRGSRSSRSSRGGKRHGRKPAAAGAQKAAGTADTQNVTNASKEKKGRKPHRKPHSSAKKTNNSQTNKDKL